MGIWDEVRPALVRLREQKPSPLKRYPSLESAEAGPPPFTVGLASWAAGVAGELHQRFGDQVELTVGALPSGPGPRWNTACC